MGRTLGGRAYTARCTSSAAAFTHDKLGLTDVFTWTKLVHWRTCFEYTVRPELKIAAAYNSFWLANSRHGLYAGGKVVARNH